MVDSAMDQSDLVEERRHPTLYFEDGDIVISATSKNKQYIVFYRVDKVLLGRHSSIFKDTFLVGGSGSHDEQYDGVPRVHLTDSAEDLAGFLGALYNTATLPLSKNCRNTPRKVEGIMRLAIKYETEMIRQVILRHTESEWPQTYDQWARQRSERESVTFLPDVRRTSRPDPALAVRFAMEFNVLKILPAAFYELAIAPDMSSGTISWDRLDAKDLRRVLEGKKRLSKAWLSTVQTMERLGRRDCDSCSAQFDIYGYVTTDCRKSAGNCIIDAIMASSVTTDCLELVRLLFVAQEKAFMDVCCCDTTGHIADFIDKQARAQWNSLPNYFSLSELGF